jgi:hypothetical protein
VDQGTNQYVNYIMGRIRETSTTETTEKTRTRSGRS